MHFLARRAVVKVFAAKGGIKNGAPKGAVPRQRGGTIYLPRAEPSTRPVMTVRKGKTDAETDCSPIAQLLSEKGACVTFWPSRLLPSSSYSMCRA